MSNFHRISTWPIYHGSPARLNCQKYSVECKAIYHVHVYVYVTKISNIHDKNIQLLA